MKRLLLILTMLLCSSQVFAQDQITTGTITTSNSCGAGGAVTSTELVDSGSGAFLLSGTWDGAIVLQGSVDGTNFDQIYATNALGLDPESSWATPGATVTRFFPAAGLKAVRLCASSWSSGTANVTVRVSRGSSFAPAGITDARGLQILTTLNDTFLEILAIEGNLGLFQLKDFDTTGATSNNGIVGIALPSATGPVIGGTAAAPLRVDPTGTTTQPVSISGSVPVTGPLTDTQLRASAVPVDVTDRSGRALGSITNSTFGVTNWLGSTAPTIGQKTMANSVPVAVASDNGLAADRTTAVAPFAVRISDGGGFINPTTPTDLQSVSIDNWPQELDHEITLQTGTLTATNQNVTLANVNGRRMGTLRVTGVWNATLTLQGSNDITNWFDMSVSVPSHFGEIATITNSNTDYEFDMQGYSAVRLHDVSHSSGTATVVIIASRANAFSSSIRSIMQRIMDVTVLAMPASLGQKTMANSFPVVLSSDQSAVPVSAASLPLPANAAKETGGNLDIIAAAYVATNGTTAPTRLDTNGGRTIDQTPQYQPLPLTQMGSAVIVYDVIAPGLRRPECNAVRRTNCSPKGF